MRLAPTTATTSGSAESRRAGLGRFAHGVPGPISPLVGGGEAARLR
jgi:hypothetical protein